MFIIVIGIELLATIGLLLSWFFISNNIINVICLILYLVLIWCLSKYLKRKEAQWGLREKWQNDVDNTQ